MEGRLTGSPGAVMAAEYIAERFEALGLLHVDSASCSYYQDFDYTISVSPGPGNTLAIINADGTWDAIPGEDYTPLFCQREWTGERRRWSSPVTGSRLLNMVGMTMRAWTCPGSWFFCLRGEPRSDDPQSHLTGTSHNFFRLRWKAVNAQNHGAIGLLVATRAG